MHSISQKVLNYLLDKYESSKSFRGENKQQQTFLIEPGKLFKKYSDDAEYDFFVEVNECIEELQEENFLFVTRLKNGVIQKAWLNVEKLEEIYPALGRTSKRDENIWFEVIWENLLSEPDYQAYTPILRAYIDHQKVRLSKNQAVEYYSGSHKDYLDLLEAVKKVVLNTQEIFIRDFSISLFGDSKRMEQLKGKVQTLLFTYGSYEEKEHVLEECGIVSTPTYVAVKGKGILVISGQRIDLSKMNGDIALSTETIKELTAILVIGNRVVTVENMTSFHDYAGKEDFVIYLGGFHNRVKREMIQFLYAMNQDKSYDHFGDIDAGGFYIYEHLCEKTGVAFKLLNMNIDVLQKYKTYWKPLTRSDKKRINQLLEKLSQKESKGECFEDYREVLRFMLKNDCKLEQESINEVKS